jgi:hypothetical protein
MMPFAMLMSTAASPSWSPEKSEPVVPKQQTGTTALTIAYESHSGIDTKRCMLVCVKQAAYRWQCGELQDTEQRWGACRFPRSSSGQN